MFENIALFCVVGIVALFILQKGEKGHSYSGLRLGLGFLSLGCLLMLVGGCLSCALLIPIATP